MKKRASVLVLALLAASATVPAPAAPEFERVVGFATKTGYRGIVSWQASEPVAGSVRWGTAPDALTQSAVPIADAVDRAQVAVVDGLPIGGTVYYRVADAISGASSDVHSFEARNAWESWNGSTYTLNLMVALDSPALGDVAARDLSLAEIAAGVNVFAERVYDALDGYARLGTVIVTDTALNYPANVPFVGTPCADGGGQPVAGTLADALIETSVPFDSHTFAGWAIERPCTAFYVGRLGQLVVPWTGDLHLGYVMTHEFIHYAFNAPDLYGGGSSGDCNNATWDGSLMHNTGGYSGARWRLTELDRSPELTPCAHGGRPWTWEVLRDRYTEVPPPSYPENVIDRGARGHPDGGALEIYLLRNLAGGLSTLTPYVPVDA